MCQNQDVVAIVQQCDGDAKKACRTLVARSERAGRAQEEVVDDITAIVVYFHKH